MDARLHALVTAAASNLVWHPEHLKVEVAAGLSSIVVSVAGHRADTGSLMGKECKHKNAIEQLLKFAANGREVKVTIGEGHIGDKSQFRDVPLKTSWSTVDDTRLSTAVLDLVDLLEFDGRTVRVQSAGQDSIVTILSPVASPELQQALHDIFRAWGRRNGRRVRVEMGKPNERQAA